MELFKGGLHYRCALPGFEETEGHMSLLEPPPIVPAASSGDAADARRLAAALSERAASAFASSALEPSPGQWEGAAATAALWGVGAALTGDGRRLKGGGDNANGNNGGQAAFDTGIFCNPSDDQCADGATPAPLSTPRDTARHR
eukprot:1881700-Prymnesium_polylepis.1